MPVIMTVSSVSGCDTCTFLKNIYNYQLLFAEGCDIEVVNFEIETGVIMSVTSVKASFVISGVAAHASVFHFLHSCCPLIIAPCVISRQALRQFH